MYTSNLVKEKLKSLGFKDQEIETVLMDISQVIVAKIIKTYLGELSEEESKIFETAKSEEDVKKIIEAKYTGEKINTFTPEDLESIVTSTWDEYFAFISAK